MPEFWCIWCIIILCFSKFSLGKLESILIQLILIPIAKNDAGEKIYSTDHFLRDWINFGITYTFTY